MSDLSEKENLNRKTLWAAVIISGLLFLFFLVNVLFQGPFFALDMWVSQHVSSLQNPALSKMVIFLTDINGIKGSLIISVLFLSYLLYTKQRSEAGFYLFAFAGASALFAGLKLWVERGRPLLKIVNEQGLSFPSGHSTTAMTMALAFYMIVKMDDTGKHRILLLFCVSWAILIAATRIYLNVHWLSDTLAGLSLGVFWVSLLRLLYPYAQTRVK